MTFLKQNWKKFFIKKNLSKIILGVLMLCLLSSGIAEADSFKRYYVTKVLDSDDKIIVEDSWGDKYIVEYGIGCLSMWRYEDEYIHINVGGAFLDGIGDTIYLLDSDDECRVWDAEELDSGSGGYYYAPPVIIPTPS